MSLDGKHALITGGSRGIGRGIALKLAEHGVKVAVHYYKNKRPQTRWRRSGSAVRMVSRFRPTLRVPRTSAECSTKSRARSVGWTSL